jgi:plasmid maintenance system antidote protein VapI
MDPKAKHPNEGARLLRREMRERKLNQSSLAKLLEDDEAQISRIVNEQRLPNVGLAVRIRDKLGIDPSMFTRAPTNTDDAKAVD